MSLIELIAGVESREATLAVVNGSSQDRETLAAHFADRNLRVTEGTLPGGPDAFAVLSRDGEFVTAVALADLLDPDETAPGFERRTYQPVLDHLDETLFTSYSKRQMIAASREIEDRAWRMGAGQLHSGFQTLDVLAKTASIYDHLAERDGLDVHAYATPEGDLSQADFTVHIERSPEIRETWFVAYDGNGVDESKCLLLAEEREPNRFYGFWSYDPKTVDDAIEYLTETYGLVETDGGKPDSERSDT